MPLVEMSEEDIAKRWLRKNNFAPVDWRVMDQLTKTYNEQYAQPLFVFDAELCGYRHVDDFPEHPAHKAKV